MDPVGPITELFRAINYIEAALWGTLGVGFAIGAGRTGGRAARWRCVVAALTLLAFGASDVVETRTGAWWHPWWLLAWKAACVLALLVLVVGWWRTSRRPKLP